MPTIQSAEIWKESGRYNDYGERCLELKIDKEEKCYMDLQMKN